MSYTSLASCPVVALARLQRVPIDELAAACGCDPLVVEDELGAYARRVDDDPPTVAITGLGETRASEIIAREVTTAEELDAREVASAEQLAREVTRAEELAVIARAKEVQAERKQRLDVNWAKQGLGELPSAPAGREPIPKAVRYAVWERDGGKCVECGSREALEFDHIIPVASGGANSERNLQLLCQDGNRRKGATLG